MKMIRDPGRAGFAFRTASDLGILDDAPPFEKLGFWLESQAGLQDL
jgi:hypothetical protein